MSETGILLLLHLLLFVYWLGGDLGVFYASFFVADERLSPAQRQTAAAILNGLDQGPRICMPLILAVGVHLAWRMGAMSASGPAVAAVWLLALVWLAMVLALHFGHGRAFVPALTRIDFAFRVLVLAGAAGVAGAALAGVTALMPAWLALKLLIFAALVGCGLMVRVRFKAFGPAFRALVTEGPSEAVNAEIRGSIQAVRPFVLAIWVGLIANAALGLHLIEP